MLFSPCDGYVRMSLTDLELVQLTHLVSGIDTAGDRITDTSAAPITGYSEWVSAGFPAITIGGDWQMSLSPGQPMLTLISEPRSNIMLQDERCHDLGPDVTKMLLSRFVDALAWRSEVADYVNIRVK